jgi:hypothetical protein
MYYARYSREARRWITTWPLPSEIIAHRKIEPIQHPEDASSLVPEHSSVTLEGAALSKATAE